MNQFIQGILQRNIALWCKWAKMVKGWLDILPLNPEVVAFVCPVRGHALNCAMVMRNGHAQWNFV